MRYLLLHVGLLACWGFFLLNYLLVLCWIVRLLVCWFFVVTLLVGYWLLCFWLLVQPLVVCVGCMVLFVGLGAVGADIVVAVFVCVWFF